MDDNRQWIDAISDLLCEAFEGMPDGQDGTWFVQGKQGIFDAIATVDAGQASKHVSPSCSTLAAHAYHTLYLMRLANMQQGRTAPEGTWEDSWTKQEVTPEEWTVLARDIATEYERYVHWLTSNEEWSATDARISTLVPLPHVAFHLGAMRQLLTIVRDGG